MKKFSLFSFFLFLSSVCLAASPVDSLKNLLQHAKEDTSKVNILLAISKNYFGESPEAAIQYGTMAKELSLRLNYTKGLAVANKNIGIGHYLNGNYLKTLEFWEHSLAAFDSLGDRAGVANIYNNIGSVYSNQRNSLKALEYYLKSLKISEKINDSVRITSALINVGSVYQDKGNWDKALEYFFQALPIAEKLNDPQLAGAILAGMGESYSHREQLDSALVYFERALVAYGETENAPYALIDLGKLYVKRKVYSSALKYFQQAYDMAKKLDSKLYMTQALIGMAGVQDSSGNSKAALITYQSAEVLANELDVKDELKDIYGGASKIYFKTKDYMNAFKYQSLLLSVKDSIYNFETNKKLASVEFDFQDEKKKTQITLLNKDKELQQKEISRQKIVRNSFIGGFAIVLLFAGVFFTQRNRISKEKKRSDELLLNILPHETAEELKHTGKAKTKSFDSVTVMFTDFKNFTQASEKLTPEELVEEINHCYSEFDKIVTKYGIEKIKTIGDSYMCAGGIPVTNKTHAEDLVKAGIEMQQFILKNKNERMALGKPFFELRCGIHTGPVVAGIVGTKKFAYDIWGDTVNTASRMESSGEIGKVNISGTTHELVKEKFSCIHRGKVEAKNKGMIDMYFVDGLSSKG